MSNANPYSQLRTEFRDPRHEISEVGQQIRAEAFKCDLPGRENQHDAEQREIHQVDDDQRKKCALICEIRLILRDHPAGEREMERPCDANYGVKQAAVWLHV